MNHPVLFRSALRGLALLLALAMAAVIPPRPAVAADEVAPETGPMLSWPYDLGVYVQSLDFIEAPGFVAGTSYQLPFRTGFAAFSPDGASLAYAAGRRIRVRQATGESTLLQGSLPRGDFSFETMQWASDGSYVIASTYNGATDTDALWRFSAGSPPERIHSQPVSTGFSFAIDPDADRVAYIREEEVEYVVDGQTLVDLDQEIRVKSTAGGAEATLSHNCEFNQHSVLECQRSLSELVWSPTGSLLVHASAPDSFDYELVWFDPGTGEFGSRERDVPDDEGSINPFLSPDGEHLAWTVNGGIDDLGRTVVAAVGGAVVTTLQRPHLAFQPCPDGACPRFVRPPAPEVPSTPQIGRASSGPKGGRLTATARWTAPGAVGTGLERYDLTVARVNRSGAVVGRSTRVIPPDRTLAALRLRAGRYKFRVRAANAAGTGGWSGYSNIVRAR